ncbi:hypothetical protein D9753_35005 [Streptomyces dangxiongensis]|uniref:Uncharacterized protein n=1 Tax=Streptomyces dangxiongensis TaxID=1442032 RepID=A0A3G2JLG8_9ACTN|nr:hypothetical protein [Streptomyces dangxiongensis]AYN43233.1 hypothetical protein D9753_35005 [Streptomyces dangxiongensis]
MRRWTTGLGPLWTLVPRLGGTARSARSGPVHLLAPDADESARLAETVDALSDGERDQATVVVAAGLSDSPSVWKWLTPVLDECRRSGITGVRLLWAGGGADLPGRPAPARRICDTWGMEVIAPAGPVVVAPDGSLFTPTGPDGWWHFSPGLGPRPLGLRHPVPSWEDAVARLTPDAVGGHVVEPVPAGVLIRTAGPVPDAERAVGASIPVDEHRLAVVVGSPGTPPVPAQALAELLALLPARARATARLVPGDGGDLLGTGQETADLLGTEVEVVSGVPALLERADGTGTEGAVVLIGADGEPSWRPYVEAVACRPAHDGTASAPRVLRWRPPVAGPAVASQDGVLALDARWQVAVTRAGLWVGPQGGVPAEASGRALARETMMVHVGLPGRRLDDGLWPVLDTLMERLEPSVQARTTLHVLGSCSAQGRQLLRGITERRGLALEYRRETSAGFAAEEPAEEGTEPEQPRTAAQAAPHAEATATEAPWHASPMSVRIRRVAAPPAPAPDAPAVPASATRKAPVPPGFAQALTASRSVGGPAGRSVPVPWQVSREGPAPDPAGIAAPAPAPARRTAAAPVPPVSPVAPPPPPAPLRITAEEDPPAPTAPARRAALPVRVTPLHRSSPSDRQAIQALAGEQWWQQQASVTRTLMVVPGLRPDSRNEEAHADLIAVRCFLTLDGGPLSWTWLERRLAVGADDALPYLSCLASGLRRLPSYRGVVVRDAGVLPAEARILPPGSELREAGPVGTLALAGAPAPVADRYLIWSVTGRRVRGLFASAPVAGKGEEVVFAPGTRFRVLGTHGPPGATTVLLREVAEGDPDARAGRHEAQDRGALAALTQAVDRAPGTGAAASWPPRLAGPLAERPREDGDGRA